MTLVWTLTCIKENVIDLGKTAREQFKSKRRPPEEKAKSNFVGCIHSVCDYKRCIADVTPCNGPKHAKVHKNRTLITSAYPDVRPFTTAMASSGGPRTRRTTGRVHGDRRRRTKSTTTTTTTSRRPPRSHRRAARSGQWLHP